MNKENYLTRSEVNRFVKILGTEHNLNAFYTDASKETWKHLYAEGMQPKDIASIWGADTRTVKIVVDPEYRAKIKVQRAKANRNYYDTHGPSKTHDDPDYTRKLIDRKISILSHDGRYVKPAVAAK